MCVRGSGQHLFLFVVVAGDSSFSRRKGARSKLQTSSHSLVTTQWLGSSSVTKMVDAMVDAMVALKSTTPFVQRFYNIGILAPFFGGGYRTFFSPTIVFVID